MKYLIEVETKYTGSGPEPSPHWVASSLRSKLPLVLFSCDYDQNYKNRVITARLEAAQEGKPMPYQLEGWDDTIIAMKYTITQQDETHQTAI